MFDFVKFRFLYIFQCNYKSKHFKVYQRKKVTTKRGRHGGKMKQQLEYRPDFPSLSSEYFSQIANIHSISMC